MIIAAAYLYFNLTQQVKEAQSISHDNNGILKEMQTERKEIERVNNIRLTNIELDQREAKIRLTTLEQAIKKAP